MKSRFCYRCAGEVEVVDGYCLLGHRAEEPVSSGHADPTNPVSEIRAEVEKVFEEADLQIQHLSRMPVSVGVTPDEVTPHAVTPDADPVVLSSTPEAHTPRPKAQASSPVRRVPPPPPPPPTTSPIRDRGEMYRRALQHLSDETPTSDPITAFAPPPRVDWGPNKVSLFNLRSLLKQRA